MQLNKILLSLIFLASSSIVEGATPTANANQQSNSPELQILYRNRIDDTDILAIPLDDSEVEDQEEINQLERRQVFDLPQSPAPQNTTSHPRASK